MDIPARRARFRALLTGTHTVRPASVWDPLSARAAEALGYDCMILAGSTAALAVLAAPDLILLTLSEFAEQARRVTRAATLPLLVDADHGYGNALNVARTVQELEAAGVAALSIEDTALPRPFAAPTETFLSIEEGAGKMRAAVEARTDPSLVILARTGAARGEGIDSAVRRARAYTETGVDGLFFVGLRTRAELEALRAATNLPFVVGGAPRELQDPAYLAAQGVRIARWNHQPVQAAALAAYTTLRAQLEADGVTPPPPLSPDTLLDHLTQSAAYDAATARYLT